MRPGQGNSCMRRLGIVALGAALLGRALGTISLGPPPQFKNYLMECERRAPYLMIANG
jgi:hypothetical protein